MANYIIQVCDEKGGPYFFDPAQEYVFTNFAIADDAARKSLAEHMSVRILKEEVIYFKHVAEKVVDD